jgi:hypothetical protein
MSHRDPTSPTAHGAGDRSDQAPISDQLIDAVVRPNTLK